jgi:hypothetical protein
MNPGIWSAGQSPLHLTHHTDNSHLWSGLATASLRVSPDRNLGALTLELSIDPNPSPVFTKTFESSSPCEIRFGIHTHLLQDGPTRLMFTARQGGMVWTLHVPFIVSNPSALASSVRDSLKRAGTPLVFAGPCDSGYYDFRDSTLAPWFDRPDAMDYIRVLATEENLIPREVAWLRDFVERGFIVMEDFVDPDLLLQIQVELDDAMARRVHGAEWGSSNRVEHLHAVYPGVRRLWKYEPIQRMLQIIFRSAPRPCQTLTYFFGSQQDAHQDTVHLTPFPAGYMCGVWVAVDDVQPNSGELEVFPGSHRLPRV